MLKLKKSLLSAADYQVVNTPILIRKEGKVWDVFLPHHKDKENWTIGSFATLGDAAEATDRFIAKQLTGLNIKEAYGDE